MGTRKRRAATPIPGGETQPDLFSLDPSSQAMHVLDAQAWPPGERFPVNRATARVGDVVRPDLATSRRPLVVAGFASIASLVDLAAEWCETDHPAGAAAEQLRVLLGAEPFPTLRRNFGSPDAGFTDEVRVYWEERGISLRQSAKVLRAIELLDAGRLTARYVHGATTLHAKIFLGDRAVTCGSSNFTAAGLTSQLEANVRFTAADDPHRYAELATVAGHLWELGRPWDEALRELLETLLQVLAWQEALAAACAELLEGQWARRYLGEADHRGASLWPSQRAGIAQALWITDRVGSALVADATGSGKTRMGAHLVRAVRDRMWATGRARRDLTVVVCPPAVEQTWQREALRAGINVQTVSHGLLSRSGAQPRIADTAVRDSQILAVDESHNFLNRDSNRTRQVRDSLPDHVLLFTATPINRGPSDLLQLVGLLGADNFADRTLDVLRRLDRRRGSDQVLSPAEVDLLRQEIQQFTVRRTKRLLNELVDRQPSAYLDEDTGRVCRYPRHDARTYTTGETDADEDVAEQIRAVTRSLSGVAQLERTIAVPIALRTEYSDQRWLSFRLSSVSGLASHHVLSAMRSSRAALVEHLAGTDAACRMYGLSRFKSVETGDVVGKLAQLVETGPPAVNLDCEVPAWLVDPDEWAEQCRQEGERYRTMLALAGELGPTRERAKADLLLELASRHGRVLAFDHHPITLEQLRTVLADRTRVVVATGSTPGERRQVESLFARTSQERAVALCSDAMNEGLNLQGASAVVHLDLPTTLRVAEQRIGRVDRMDSPHDVIEAYWPRDGRAFATRANELLSQRAAESAQLLGSNLPVPDLRLDDAPPPGEDDVLVDVEARIAEAERPGAETWDGIRDALDPVRLLVDGDEALVTEDCYRRAAGERSRSVTRLAVVEAERPWAFLTVAAGAHGAPRWLLLTEDRHAVRTHGMSATSDLDEVARGLRRLLALDPPGRTVDAAAVGLLQQVLDAAAIFESRLLPRRSRRALAQMVRLTAQWSAEEQRAGREADAQRWAALRRVADVERRTREDGGPDPQLVAEQWVSLVRPRLERFRSGHRHLPFVVLRDLDDTLSNEPLGLGSVEAALAELPELAPLAERVGTCILGVPPAADPIATRPVEHRWGSR